MKFLKRSCVLLLCMLLVLTVVPCSTPAAAKPKFQTKRTYIYENHKTTDWVYTLKNVSKGQTVKWSLTGSGKSYARLKYATPRRVTSSKISNSISLNTNGSSKAQNKTVTLVAKVYDKKGKFLTKATTSSKIKVLSTGIAITGGASDNAAYYTGSSYAFGTTLTPGNSTDTVKWTVTDALGADVSFYMTSEGVFSTNKSGTYQIKATSYSGTARRYSATKTIQVKDPVSGISQTGLNSFKVQVTPSLFSSLTKDSFKITGSNGTTYPVKEISKSSNNYITVTAYNNFSNGITYTVTFDNLTRSFTASSGLPCRIEILTNQVIANKPTKIKYALYDQNGIDVTAYYPGTLSFRSTLPGVIITTDYKLTMSTVSSATNLTVTFIPANSYIGQLVGSTTVVCVANETAVNTNFTITTSSSEPNYKLTNYSDNHKVSTGSNAYAQFRAVDKNGDAISYDKIEYYSDNSDALIINQTTGRITAIKNATVTISVRTIQNGIEQWYPYTVTITNASYLTSVSLDKQSITMSNVYNSSYVEYINVSAKDQYGNTFLLDNETVSFYGPSYPKVSYNKATNQICVAASGTPVGDYSYTASITCGSHTVNTYFTVKVINTAITGTTTYALAFDNQTIDTAIGKDSTAGDKYATLKLVRNVDNVFSNYATFNVLGISKDGKFYNTNLTNSRQATISTMSNISQLSLLVSTTSYVTNGYYSCKTAEPGTYSIDVSYYRSDGMLCYDTIKLYITDSNPTPVATVTQTTSTTAYATALQLAKNCIAVDRGTIIDCTVVGTTVAGSNYSIASDTQYHIQSVTVETSTQISSGAYVTKRYVVPVNKTIKNK